MASGFSVVKLGNITELEIWLNGGLQGGLLQSGLIQNGFGFGVDGLVGKTLTFTAPAFAVTFTASSNPNQANTNILTFKDIKSQIEAAATAAAVDLRVLQIAGRIWFVEKTPTLGVALSSNNEPAKALLGFDSVSTVGRILKPSTSSTGPKADNIISTVDGSIIVIVWEG